VGKRRTENQKPSYQDLHDFERDFFITSMTAAPRGGGAVPAEAETAGPAGSTFVDR
jgi:hypothetical protein